MILYPKQIVNRYTVELDGHDARIVSQTGQLVASAGDVGQSAAVILQQAKMRLWTSSDCVSSYSYATPLMLCAGYKSGYIANCRVCCQDNFCF